MRARHRLLRVLFGARRPPDRVRGHGRDRCVPRYRHGRLARPGNAFHERGGRHSPRAMSRSVRSPQPTALRHWVEDDIRAVRPYAAWMLLGVATITALRLVWLALQPADLFPDEAQYWVWSQRLALGYYSKPPLVAWLIALTTGLFGDGEFAVRLSAPLLHAGAAIFVYATGARLFDRRAEFWSALAYASLPGVSVSAFIISTDAALLLFWAAALYCFIRAREDGGRGWWVAVGLAA